jgi:hypothetical protein
MKYTVVLGATLAAALLSGCGMNNDEIRQHMSSWKGQTDASLTGTFGLPQKTLDMAGGSKVYHYDFAGSKCAGDFQIDSKQVIQDVQLTGSDLSRCPRKLPGGGTF